MLFTYHCWYFSISKYNIKKSLIDQELVNDHNPKINVKDVFENLCSIKNLTPYYKPCHDRSTHNDKTFCPTNTVFNGPTKPDQGGNSNLFSSYRLNSKRYYSINKLILNQWMYSKKNGNGQDCEIFFPKWDNTSSNFPHSILIARLLAAATHYFLLISIK